MARRPKPLKTPTENLDQLRVLLSKFENLNAPDLRERVRALVPSVFKLRDVGISLMPEYTAKAARDRILAYFKMYPMTVIDGDELMVISGIGEWARRVRELRKKFGWLINSGVTFKEIAEDQEENWKGSLKELEAALGRNPKTLKPTEYVLLSSEPDKIAAYRWNTLNDLRKSSGSVKDKILRYLLANVGHPVPGEELRYVAKDRKEWARRARELRTEEGWSVATRMSGRQDLPVGVYILQDDKQAPEHDRHITDATRVEVLNRDSFSCAVCGWKQEDATPADPRRFLELHHVVHHREKGDNTTSNLLTLCNVHHDEVHRDKAANDRAQEILRSRIKN